MSSDPPSASQDTVRPSVELLPSDLQLLMARGQLFIDDRGYDIMPSVRGWIEEALSALARLQEEHERLTEQNEALKASHAAMADKFQQFQIDAENKWRDWGHHRAVILAALQSFERTARNYAAGQPAYVPTFKKRATQAEAEVERLREALNTLRWQRVICGSCGTRYRECASCKRNESICADKHASGLECSEACIVGAALLDSRDQEQG